MWAHAWHVKPSCAGAHEPFWYMFSPQRSLEHDFCASAPVGQYVPFAHAMHSKPPLAMRYVPAAQRMATEAPSLHV